jgi:hypothetical protein
MTTQNKDFRVKNGLVVEGNSATVNGNQVLTTASDLTGLVDAAVSLGNEYPTDKSNGSLFYNTSTNRFAVFHDSVWRELAYLTEVSAIFGGDSETSFFSNSYDGGDSFTTMFVGAVSGGTSDSDVAPENYLIQ